VFSAEGGQVPPGLLILGHQPSRIRNGSITSLTVLAGGRALTTRCSALRPRRSELQGTFARWPEPQVVDLFQLAGPLEMGGVIVSSP